jgi:GNAT superfamily N-acetyltransferase
MTTEDLPGLVIRQADETDIAGILQLYADPAMDNEKVLDLETAQSIFAAMQRVPDYHLYVAEQDADLVGSFALLMMPNLGHLGAPSGIMEDVVVAEKHRGSGIGRAMVDRAIALCRAKGCYKTMLSSNLSRKGAHAFYERLGFERHGYSYRVAL